MISITPCYIRAALMHAPKNDIRHYLNTVAVELVQDHVVVVATDGGTLFAAWEYLPHDQPAGTFLFERGAVDLAIKAKPIAVELNPTDRTLTIGLTTVPALSDDVVFPDWRAVLPANPEPGLKASYYPQLDPAFELRCMQSLAVACRKSPSRYLTVHRYSGGDADSPVQYCHLDLNAIALAMPLRYPNVDPTNLPVPPQ